MPTYEYSCDHCSNEFELEQRISDDPIKKCPKCGKSKARRMIAGGNFILKGGGWYSDLYSSTPKTSKSSSTPPAKKETKTESKPKKPSPASD